MYDRKRGYKRKEWTRWEDKYLQQHYPIQSNQVKEIAETLKRSEQAVYLRAQVLGLTRQLSTRRRDDDPDLDWKIYKYRKMNLSVREIGDKLGMRKGQVQNRMYSRGLHYHPPAGPVPEWFKNKF